MTWRRPKLKRSRFGTWQSRGQPSQEGAARHKNIENPQEKLCIWKEQANAKGRSTPRKEQGIFTAVAYWATKPVCPTLYTPNFPNLIMSLADAMNHVPLDAQHCAEVRA